MSSPFRLCYITDRHTLEPDSLPRRMAEAVRAGVDLIQIREKDLGTRELAALVASAVDAARGAKARVVVNDRMDVALALGAVGVHLGGQSMPARVARAGAPAGFLVGVSCHSLEESLAAEAAGADYIVLGPIFKTASKLRYGPPLGLGALAAVTARVKIPVLALGGVSVERVKPCLKAGATGIAGISVFQDCVSVEQRVRELLLKFSP